MIALTPENSSGIQLRHKFLHTWDNFEKGASERMHVHAWSTRQAGTEEPGITYTTWV